ncbi:MAG: hypothetical protein Q4B42_00980 [Oscillospiraceae bacterium]|nr:hypothetical protein [Oscillospiraceae bacterium]
MYTEAIDRLLREHNMHPALFDMDAELEKFKADFRLGLERENLDSLMMLPSFIPAGGSPEKDRPIIAVDAGGTNLRTAVVSFDGEGELQISDFVKLPMPGAQRALSSADFYNALAERLLPVAGKSDTVGFCFSYPFHSLPDRDAEALPLCKEVRVDGIEGTHVGEETERALKALGAKGSRRYTLINDTVAVMLAGLSTPGKKEYDGYIGLILGTGLNTCCAVDTKDIKKTDVSHFAHEQMIINMELGNYAHFPRGTVDIELDRASAIPAGHLFEKMISGAYLGEVLHRTMKLAVREGLFSEECKRRVMELPELRLSYVDRYLRGDTEENPLSSLPQTEDDIKGLGYIIGAVYARAARALAVSLCGILECTDVGKTPERPACVCVEGTTFHKSENLRALINECVEGYIKGERGRWLEFVKIENATLAGTAVAAALD